MDVFGSGRRAFLAVLCTAFGAAGCHTVQTAPSPFEAALGIAEHEGRRERVTLGDDGELQRVEVDAAGKAQGSLTDSRMETHEELRHLGIQLLDLPADLATGLYGVPSAVVVGGCTLGGPAYRAGVRRGDRLLAVDGDATSHAASAVEALGRLRGGDAVALRVSGPLGEHEVSVVAKDDLSRDFETSIPIVMNAEKTVSASEFQLVGGLLLHREAEFWPAATREIAHHVRFGIALNLFRVETSPDATEIRIAWLIPIRF